MILRTKSNFKIWRIIAYPDGINSFVYFRLMSGLWILILGGIMFMFVGGPVKEMAFAVGGAILFSGTFVLKCLENK